VTCGLAIPTFTGDNTVMTLTGHFQNGVIVPDPGTPAIPDGTPVSFIYIAPANTVKSDLPATVAKPRKTKFFIKESKNPGSVKLTNEMIADILDEEDAAMAGRIHAAS
jgi:hypothetical protein